MDSIEVATHASTPMTTNTLAISAPPATHAMMADVIATAEQTQTILAAAAVQMNNQSYMNNPTTAAAVQIFPGALPTLSEPISEPLILSGNTPAANNAVGDSLSAVMQNAMLTNAAFVAAAANLSTSSASQAVMDPLKTVLMTSNGVIGLPAENHAQNVQLSEVTSPNSASAVSLQDSAAGNIQQKMQAPAQARVGRSRSLTHFPHTTPASARHANPVPSLNLHHRQWSDGSDVLDTMQRPHSAHPDLVDMQAAFFASGGNQTSLQSRDALHHMSQLTSPYSAITPQDTTMHSALDSATARNERASMPSTPLRVITSKLMQSMPPNSGYMSSGGESAPTSAEVDSPMTAFNSNGRLHARSDAEASATGRCTCRWAGCNEIFFSLEDLIHHVGQVHIGSGKPGYVCEWEGCTRGDKPFTKRHKMYNHLRTHTGERPYQCGIEGCGKRFSRPDSLSTHIKTHSNVRPFHCRYKNCGKSYYHSRSLRKHERTHELLGDLTMSGSSGNNDVFHPGMNRAMSSQLQSPLTPSNTSAFSLHNNTGSSGYAVSGPFTVTSSLHQSAHSATERPTHAHSLSIGTLNSGYIPSPTAGLVVPIANPFNAAMLPTHPSQTSQGQPTVSGSLMNNSAVMTTDAHVSSNMVLGPQPTSMALHNVGAMAASLNNPLLASSPTNITAVTPGLAMMPTSIFDNALLAGDPFGACRTTKLVPGMSLPNLPATSAACSETATQPAL